MSFANDVEGFAKGVLIIAALFGLGSILLSSADKTFSFMGAVIILGIAAYLSKYR